MTATATEHTLHVLDTTGDTRTMWDPTRPTEVEEARKQFQRMQKKGYLAHTVRDDGEPGEVIREFDPQAGKIIMRPQLVGG